MAIKWKQKYSVKVKEIDEQHKELISTMNHLYDVIYHNKKDKSLKSILAELVNYAELHFETEEKYFEQFAYELSEEHKKEHDDFRTKIGDFVKELSSVKDQEHERELSFSLIDFLQEWISDHLMEQDQKYVECFTSHGLS